MFKTNINVDFNNTGIVLKPNTAQGQNGTQSFHQRSRYYYLILGFLTTSLASSYAKYQTIAVKKTGNLDSNSTPSYPLFSSLTQNGGGSQ